MSAPEYTSLRIPYDDVTSPFVRERRRSGRSADPEYRSYVNDLAYTELSAAAGDSPVADRRSFGPFRFPECPYPDADSDFERSGGVQS